MTMGEPGKNTIRIPDLKDCQEVIDVFYKYGHRELDTARQYGEGTTEEVSSQILERFGTGTHTCFSIYLSSI